VEVNHPFDPLPLPPLTKPTLFNTFALPFCNMRPPTVPLVYAIHHPILVMAESCKGHPSTATGAAKPTLQSDVDLGGGESPDSNRNGLTATEKFAGLTGVSTISHRVCAEPRGRCDPRKRRTTERVDLQHRIEDADQLGGKVASVPKHRHVRMQEGESVKL